jgi:hypothetical protein
VRSVSVTIDDVTHEGAYFLRDAMVHVRSPLGTKSAQVGGSLPNVIAKLLLSELARGHKAYAIRRLVELGLKVKAG